MRVPISGLSEAYDKERRLREEVYLGQPHYVCGIPLAQITPSIFARLLLIRTPFIGGGDVTPGAIGHFLWACHRDFSLPSKGFLGWWRHRQRDRFLASLKRLDFAELEAGIDEFLDATFLDMPQGGVRDSTPYVCGVAWMEYRMALDPFRWDSARTLDTPLRRIYQLIRCHDAAQGQPLFNKFSDAVKDKFLRTINEPKGDN